MICELALNIIRGTPSRSVGLGPISTSLLLKQLMVCASITDHLGASKTFGRCLIWMRSEEPFCVPASTVFDLWIAQWLWSVSLVVENTGELDSSFIGLNTWRVLGGCWEKVFISVFISLNMFHFLHWIHVVHNTPLMNESFEGWQDVPYSTCIWSNDSVKPNQCLQFRRNPGRIWTVLLTNVSELEVMKMRCSVPVALFVFFTSSQQRFWFHPVK